MVSASGYDSMPFEIHSGVRYGCALSHIFFNYIIDWILVQALQGSPRVQVEANVHVSDPAYADGIVIVRSSYCIVYQISGNYKGQVQLNTLISTAAKGEKTII